MSKIAVITDSDSSLPHDLAGKYGIRQVPITIHFENENYTTGVDINDASVFELIDLHKKIPTTSAPPPSAFAQAYQAAFDDGADAVVCICVSSAISGTFSAAQTACELFPEKEIRVLDSLNLTMCQGFMVLIAAEAAARGASLDEIEAAVSDARQRLHIFGALPTLKYLAMSGRVGKMVAGMADTFDIKPILTVREGKLEMLEKVRTQKKALLRVLELTSQTLAGGKAERMAIVHVNNLEGAENLRRMLCENLSCPEDILVVEFSAGLSVHAGSGLVGVVFLAGN